MRSVGSLLLAVLILCSPGFASAESAEQTIERVTTIAPYPRGLAIVDGDLYVLCRGRVRGAGGVTAAIDDQAGTIYRVHPNVTEPLHADVGESVRSNGEIVARPTDPPFLLWDRTADPPESDRRTDRPYCTLRYHEPTRSFYICGFSGIDKARTKQDRVAFSKNRTDSLLRFDLRTKKWHVVDRHDLDSYDYPHHDPNANNPPHGWLKGPDNILMIGNYLYAAAKDNSRLVVYDLSAHAADPEAPPPAGRTVLRDSIDTKNAGMVRIEGHSAAAEFGGWLYVATRTSSHIVRVKLEGDGRVVEPIVADLIAQFDPWNPTTGHSADLTDMGFDEHGRLYIVSAQPARVFRFTPDPAVVFDARGQAKVPWVDLAAATDNPRMKSENVLYHDGWLYVTSGDGYGYQRGAEGTVYRVRVDLPAPEGTNE